MCADEIVGPGHKVCGREDCIGPLKHVVLRCMWALVTAACLHMRALCGAATACFQGTTQVLYLKYWFPLQKVTLKWLPLSTMPEVPWCTCVQCVVLQLPAGIRHLPAATTAASSRSREAPRWTPSLTSAMGGRLQQMTRKSASRKIPSSRHTGTFLSSYSPTYPALLWLLVR
jgi:hypothetical protein